jgi:hypothetical protein
MWKRLYLLAETLLRFTQRKNYITELMGKEAVTPPEEDEEYERISVNDGDPGYPRTNQGESWRTLVFQNKKFVVGKELPEGVGMRDLTKRTLDPSLCQHPTDLMFARGGRGDKKWWLCQACGTRWQRIPLDDLAPRTETLGSRDRITFGKYLGQSYQQVYLNHPDYCQWVLQTAETGDAPSWMLIRFAKWLATKEARTAEEIAAGKMDESL